MFPPIVRIVAAAIPGAETMLLPGAGHIPHTTHPADLVNVILEFASKHSH